MNNNISDTINTSNSISVYQDAHQSSNNKNRNNLGISNTNYNNRSSNNNDQSNSLLHELIDNNGNELNDELFELAEGVLPPHVASILSQVEINHGNHGEPKVGPYRSIFDIPFVFVPCLGKHRRHAIYVTLDAPLYEALYKMLMYNIESIAVCNEVMNVVDVIVQSDLLRM